MTRSYSGSFCIAGAGIMRATKIGAESHINRLSVIAKQYKLVKTPTQIKIDITVEVAVVIMAIFVPLIFVTGFYVGNEFLEIVRNAVVFTTSLVPQGLVLVAILVADDRRGQNQPAADADPARQRGRIAGERHRALLRQDWHLDAEYKLAVREIIQIEEMDGADILSELRSFLKNLAHLNNTAQAIDRYIDGLAIDTDYPQKLKEIPFSSGRKWAAVCLPRKTLLMGAPERLLPSDSAHYQRAEALSADGMRVLAFAQMAGEPDVGAGVAAYDVEALALIVMSDQIRDDIQETLAAFRDEGLTLKVISGDNIETVRAIAAASGMDIGSARL